MEQDCTPTQSIDSEGKQDYDPTQSIDVEGKQDCSPTQSIDVEGKQDCISKHLIDGDGELKVAELESFIQSAKFGECGKSYAVVAIMGPQSSGKSTLLNNLFFTNFQEMVAEVATKQTTLGIWMAKAVGVEPFTIVLDIEGNGGRERANQGNIGFEKQTALFGLALADVVLINMWCKDVGLNEGGNKPLLKNVFQVMTKLFTPRKTTLLFVIRDKNQTPLATLKAMLEGDLQKIWQEVVKHPAHADAKLEDFFIVKVIALPHYEYQKELFYEQVGELREMFNNSIAPGGLAGDRQGVVPAAGFSLSAQHMWKIIRENKDLNLPDHKIMVATVRCEEISNEKFGQFCKDEDWLALESEAKTGPILGFGEKLSKLLEDPLSEYDNEAMYFDEGIREDKRRQLLSKLLELVRPAYKMLLDHLSSQAYERFVTKLEEALSGGEGFAASVRHCKESCLLEFDEQCKDAIVQQAVDWDISNVIRKTLECDIEVHSSSLHSKKLSEIVAHCEKKLTNTIEMAPIESLLEDGKNDSWPRIRELLNHEIDTVALEFLDSISGFELDYSESEQILQNLRGLARSLVEKKARETAKRVLVYMKASFLDAFQINWKGNEDITKITLDARIASMKILSAVTIPRFDEGPDTIQTILLSSLTDKLIMDPSNDVDIEESEDPLASEFWDEISPEDTIITPMKCKSLWKEFLEATESTITKSNSAKVMAASIRCDAIFNEKFSQFQANKVWLELKDAVKSGPVSDFGKKLSPILETYLSEYDKEATGFDEQSRHAKRKQLESKLLESVHSTYKTLLDHLHAGATDRFKTQLDEALYKREGFAASVVSYKESCMLEFDQQCADAVVQQAVDWDPSNFREKLRHDIEAYSSSLRSKKLSEIVARGEKKLLDNIVASTESLLKSSDGDSWSLIRSLLKDHTDTVALEFRDSVAGFELDQSICGDMLQSLKEYARSQIVERASETANSALLYMKDRFSTAFYPDGDSKPRDWNGTEDIAKIKSDVQTGCLKMLSVMAAIRLDEHPDNIKEILFSCLMNESTNDSSSLSDGEKYNSGDPLASSVWDEVSPENTLITPVRCKSLWTEFLAATEGIVTQAISAQEKAVAARCNTRVDEKVGHFRKDKDWIALEGAAKAGRVSDFGKKLSSILENHLSEFDKDFMQFDEDLRGEKHQQLLSELLRVAHPAYETLHGHLLTQAKKTFKTQMKEALDGGKGFQESAKECEELCLKEFDKQCEDAAIRQAEDWNTSNDRETLSDFITNYSSSLIGEKLSELVANYKKKISKDIRSPAESLLQNGSSNSWSSIRDILTRHIDIVVPEFRISVSGFELDESTCEKMEDDLKNYARTLVVERARDTAKLAVHYMTLRFKESFEIDKDKMPRQWTADVDIKKLAQEARSRSLEVLAVLAAIRLDEGSDNIKTLLISGLLNSSTSDALLTSGFWEEVPPADTLLPPVQCKIVWNNFITATIDIITDATNAQKKFEEQQQAKIEAKKEQERQAKREELERKREQERQEQNNKGLLSRLFS